MRKLQIVRLFVCAAFLMCGQLVFAVDMKAGKWSFTSTTTMPMAAPMVETTEECIAEDYDAIADLKEGMAEGGMQCDVEVTKDTDTELSATVSCAIPGAGTMNGSLEFVIEGESASSDLLMSMDMGGQTMNINSSSTAEYLGACS